MICHLTHSSVLFCFTLSISPLFKCIYLLYLGLNFPLVYWLLQSKISSYSVVVVVVLLHFFAMIIVLFVPMCKLPLNCFRILTLFLSCCTFASFLSNNFDSNLSRLFFSSKLQKQPLPSPPPFHSFLKIFLLLIHSSGLLLVELGNINLPFKLFRDVI